MTTSTVYSSPSRFLFHDTPSPQIYTLSLHDALPIYAGLAAYEERASSHWTERVLGRWWPQQPLLQMGLAAALALVGDRKSTRLNSSHVEISYAVFCLKKKKLRDRPLRLNPSIKS